jgi:hypothetical protein
LRKPKHSLFEINFITAATPVWLCPKIDSPFTIISVPLLKFDYLKLDSLSEATIQALHHLVATGFWIRCGKKL